MENARPIPGFPGYAITRDGQVYDTQTTPPTLRRIHRCNGVPALKLKTAERPYGKSVYLHLMLVAAWGPPQPSPKHRIRHVDNDVNNYQLDNLVWMSRSEMRRSYQVRSARGEKAWRAKLTNRRVRAIRRRLAAGQSRASIAKRFGVSDLTIYRVGTGRIWSHVPSEATAAA